MRALTIPLKVLATLVKLAIPPPMIKHLPRERMISFTSKTFQMVTGIDLPLSCKQQPAAALYKPRSLGVRVMRPRIVLAYS